MNELLFGILCIPMTWLNVLTKLQGQQFPLLTADSLPSGTLLSLAGGHCLLHCLLFLHPCLILRKRNMGDVSTIHQTFVVFSSCCLPYCIHTCIYTPFLISNVCYSVLVLCLEFRSYFEICLFSDPNMHKVCLTFKAVLTVNKELFPANLCTEVQTLRNNYPVFITKLQDSFIQREKIPTLH